MRQYSLTELCTYIQDALYQNLESVYWVRAEISDIYIKQHAYLELVDKPDHSSQITAKVRATCWANTYNMLSAYFMQITGHSLTRGMQVLVKVTVQFHPVYGLSLNIEDIDPQYTLGDLARQRQETIERLKKEGVLDMQQMHVLPTLIRRIAIISAPTAAGYEDFCDQLRSNAYHFNFQPTLFPAIMQGESAEKSQIEALDKVLEHYQDFDVLVVIRGGGATTDLNCFDSYLLSAAYAQAPLPVITGIGHTKDISVVDMVAFKSLKTPTAVAEYIISHNAQQVERLLTLQQRLQNVTHRFVANKRQELRLRQQQLLYAIKQIIKRQQQQLLFYDKTIDLHSPEAIFRRGYSLTTINGQAVRDLSQLTKGDVIVTHLLSGKITSTVDRTQTYPHEKGKETTPSES